MHFLFFCKHLSVLKMGKREETEEKIFVKCRFPRLSEKSVFGDIQFGFIKTICMHHKKWKLHKSNYNKLQ